MTDKERLEEIKEAYRLAINILLASKLNDSDTECLINRVEELEKEKDEWKDTAQSYYMTNQELREQNKRYKQALKYIMELAEYDEYENILEQIYDYTEKALEL